jgi:6-phosphofructokinase 1
LVAEGQFGRMVAHLGTHIGSVPLQEAVRSLKTVPTDGGLVRTARSMNVCLGD